MHSLISETQKNRNTFDLFVIIMFSRYAMYNLHTCIYIWIVATWPCRHAYHDEPWYQWYIWYHWYVDFLISDIRISDKEEWNTGTVPAYLLSWRQPVRSYRKQLFLYIDQLRYAWIGNQKYTIHYDPFRNKNLHLMYLVHLIYDITAENPGIIENILISMIYLSIC